PRLVRQAQPRTSVVDCPGNRPYRRSAKRIAGRIDEQANRAFDGVNSSESAVHVGTDPCQD
ncbi:MAG TPA: hypothetical protein VL068_09305, partial [Microthrixaceae bacterium]|nr:hypothetical protein [Microthrixaceae bacterium]